MSNATAKFLSDLVLNYIKGTSPSAPPANLYVGLFSVTPTANTGSGTEISGSSYVRVAVASSAWSAISQNADTIHDQISNSGVITFPAVTTTSYTVNGIGVWDASTAGNLWIYQAVTAQLVAVGNQYQIAIGGLILEF